MSNSLAAQVVVDISLDPTQNKVMYSVCTHEGECTGINQLAERVSKSVLEHLPQCSKPTGAKE